MRLNTLMIITVLGSLVIGPVVVWATRLLLVGGRGKRKRAEALTLTGERARATIVSIAPTGTIVNEINIRCAVTFEIEPLDGKPTFTGIKKMLINQVQTPRIGDVWPCWYDPKDPSQFAIAQPIGDTRDQIPIFREFGITHPLDAHRSSADDGPTRPSRVKDLERLAKLQAQGVLTSIEFDREKRRLLDGP